MRCRTATRCRWSPKRLTTIDGPVGLQFTDGGRQLQTTLPAGIEHSVMTMDVAPLAEIVADPLGSACAIVGRGLSTAEWERQAPALSYQETCRS